jgi:hypothetical protein
MSPRLAITIDADDGRLTNVRGSIGRIHTCWCHGIPRRSISLGGKAGFSSRDTESVAPIEPMSQKSPRTSAFCSEPTFRLDPRQDLSAQPRCATPRQSLIQFDDCCGFSTAATVPGRLDVARGSDSPPVAAPDVIVLVVNCHRIVAKELSTRVRVDRKSLRRYAGPSHTVESPPWASPPGLVLAPMKLAPKSGPAAWARSTVRSTRT